MTAIPVLYSFARSGGTLVNQMLGTHPDCLVLSEVNPAASYMPVVEQAVQWLHLVELHEAPSVAALPYRRQIALLRERAAAKGKVLVVRDWVTPNFLRGSAGGVEPSGRLEQALYLEREGLEPQPLVVTRRANAVYRSIGKNFSHLAELTLDTFADAYLAYAHAVARLPRLQMEAIRRAPQEGVERLFAHFRLDVAAVSAVLRDFHEFRQCTGNTTLEGNGGSSDARTVLPPEEVAASTHPQLAEADRLLGYDG